MCKSVQTPRIFMGPLMSLDNRWAKLSEQLGPGLTHALIKAVLFTAKLVDVAFPPKIEPHFSGTSQLYHNFATPRWFWITCGSKSRSFLGFRCALAVWDRWHCSRFQCMHFNGPAALCAEAVDQIGSEVVAVQFLKDLKLHSSIQ